MYEGYTDQELQNKIIYVLEKETYKVIDSMEVNYPQNQFVIDKWFMYNLFGDKREFKMYSYLLALKSRQDTLYDIQYDRSTEKIDCNSCFPFGDGSAALTNYENLEYVINDNFYQNIDSVFMYKHF